MIGDREKLAAAIDERDAWIRLFNRLEAAVTHHKRDTAGFASATDDGLYHARDKILTDAANCSVPDGPVVSVCSRLSLPCVRVLQPYEVRDLESNDLPSAARLERDRNE